MSPAPDPQAPVSSWPALQELADRYGVSTEYWDWRGAHQPTSVGTVVAVLAAFGVDAATEEAARTALAAVDEAPWRRMLPPVVVMRAGRPGRRAGPRPPRRGGLRRSSAPEDGLDAATTQAEHNVAPREVDGALVGEARFVLPGDLPLGLPRGARELRAQPPPRRCWSSPPTGSTCPPTSTGRSGA